MREQLKVVGKIGGGDVSSTCRCAAKAGARSSSLSLPILIRELGPVGYARFIQQDEAETGNCTRDRHQWVGEERARTLHEQATQLATAGELHRPAGAKLLALED